MKQLAKDFLKTFTVIFLTYVLYCAAVYILVIMGLETVEPETARISTSVHTSVVLD